MKSDIARPDSLMILKLIFMLIQHVRGITYAKKFVYLKK